MIPGHGSGIEIREVVNGRILGNSNVITGSGFFYAVDNRRNSCGNFRAMDMRNPRCSIFWNRN
jgi:hypothetical protein